MEVKCKTQHTLPLEELTEFQGNLKERDSVDVGKIIKSIRKHGFSFPFFVWNHDAINHVLDGHGRLLALKQMAKDGENIPELPIVYVDCRDESDAKELLLKLNSQYGKMTAESIKDFLGDLKIDFTELAIPDGFLDLSVLEEEKEKSDDDAVPDIDYDTPAESERGQVYELGPHRLMCGDSTSSEDMAILMNGAKADLIVTDPPYNVAYEGNHNPLTQNEYNHGKNRNIQNDKKNDQEFLEFLEKSFTNMFDHLKKGGVYYIWHADSEGFNFRQAIKNCGGIVRQCLVWVKNRIVMGRQDYQWKHEPCLYGWKEGAGHYWEGSRNLTTTIDDRPNYKKMSKEELLEEIKKLRGEDIPSTIIYEDRPSRSEEHPTMKPVKLFERLIKNSSKEEDVVLDPFGGSGTTIIAAQKLNRHARLMELDPRYCDVIRRRWTKYAQENDLPIGPGGLE
jgi:site-specific DNA-methyltransferase (adenine-specific)